MPASANPVPFLGDVDGDPNIDLQVKFDQTALATLLNRTEGGTAIVRATWVYPDGTEGAASAQLDVIRGG